MNNISTDESISLSIGLAPPDAAMSPAMGNFIF